MSFNWSEQDIIDLIKFINYIWRKVERTEEDLDDLDDIDNLESKLQHLSESLEYLRREAENAKSIINTNDEKKRDVGILLGQLSIDLNVLDIFVGKIKANAKYNEENFNGLRERLGKHLEELNGLVAVAQRESHHHALPWLHSMTTTWHHVHWAELVEVKSSKHGDFYQAERLDEVLRIDLRKEGIFDDCITVYVQFQGNDFGTKFHASNVEITAPTCVTIGDLKAALRERTGVPICQQLLSHRGSMLDNGKLLTTFILYGVGIDEM